MDNLLNTLIGRIEKAAAHVSGFFDRIDRLSTTKLLGIYFLLYAMLIIPAWLEPKVCSIAKLLHYDRSDYLLKFFYMSALALLEGIIFAAILVSLYTLFYYFYTRRGFSVDYKKIIGIGLLFAFVVIWIDPFMSEDILFYIVRGRVESVYGENPYTVSYSRFPNDKFYNISDYQFHKELTSVYGPLFGHISQLLTRINKNSIRINILIFKLFNVFVHLINIWLILQIISLPKAQFPDDAKKLLFYCWHPLIILELLLNGHNDILVVSFLLMVVVSIKKAKPNLALIFLSLGVLTKITPLILYPHYLIYSLKNLKNDSRGRGGFLRLILALAVSCGLIVAVSFPYFNTLAAFNGFSLHAQSLNLFQTLIKGLLDLPALLPASLVPKVAKLISFIIFLPLYGRTLCQLWNDPTEKKLFESSAYTLAIFIIMVNPKYSTWYLTWLIPFLIPMANNSILRLYIMWTFSSLLFYFPTFVFRKYYYGGDPLNILFNLIVIYGLPLSFYLYSRRKACKSCNSKQMILTPSV